ncbi:MAG: calcium:proton antiporter [Angustibacter sp.]
MPPVAVAFLILAWTQVMPAATQLGTVMLVGSVLAAVQHAEVVAHRVGEPFGSLILAVAVTIVEVGLIVTLMASGGDGSPELARNTVFAAVMITCNGMVGLCLLIGALRRDVAVFNAEGSAAALGAVVTLATLCLVVPRFAVSQPGPEFTPPQLTFAALASLVLYGVFVIAQNVRHRHYFLPPHHDPDAGPADDEHAPSVPNRVALRSVGLLVLALVGVVGLAKVESAPVGEAIAAAGLPASFVGVVIALLVLAPETLAAARNASRDRVQIGLNLALGSAMASIGLTIPAIAVATIWLDDPLVLGLDPVQIVLLALTAVVGTLTLVSGKAGVLRAGVHLTIAASFVFLAAAP